MAKKTNKSEDQFVQVEEALTRTEQFIEDNQQKITRLVTVVVVIIALIIGVKKLYLEPLQSDAQSDMYMAELYFQKDSFNIALNGDGQYLGFIDIADEYSLTKSGDLANYYAGLCYLNLGDFENAIDYLKDFSSDDIILSSLALGCIGDAYMELDDINKALGYYNDAANNNINSFTTPKFLFKQAMIYELEGDFSDALDIYNTIKDDYSDSREANQIEKYISRVKNR
tara:strand:+ start:1726 stop:2406 length:681 start_codon:yes stop_codon:yes gene_type:complete